MCVCGGGGVGVSGEGVGMCGCPRRWARGIVLFCCDNLIHGFSFWTSSCVFSSFFSIQCVCLLLFV